MMPQWRHPYGHYGVRQFSGGGSDRHGAFNQNAGSNYYDDPNDRHHDAYHGEHVEHNAEYAYGVGEYYYDDMHGQRDEAYTHGIDTQPYRAADSHHFAVGESLRSSAGFNQHVARPQHPMQYQPPFYGNHQGNAQTSHPSMRRAAIRAAIDDESLSSMQRSLETFRRVPSSLNNIEGNLQDADARFLGTHGTGNLPPRHNDGSTSRATSSLRTKAPLPELTIADQKISTNRSARLQQDERVPVSQIPDPFHKIFPFEHFNAMQSLVYSEAIETDNSIVVTAPTGAGKTAIFEMTIVRMLIHSKQAKAVYIAPTKALCSERVNDWKQRFDVVDCQVAELTGDSAPSLEDFEGARLIVATPEKLDAMSRRIRHDDPVFSKLGLFLIDEIHLVQEAERGARLEVLVARLKSLRSQMRCVAVSATIPNANDIAEWVGGPSTAGSPTLEPFVFGEEFRPCPLVKHVLGYAAPRGDFWAMDKLLLAQLPGVVEQFSQGKPTLIFCGTRKAATTTAEHLAKTMTNQGGLNGRINDATLRALMPLGVAFHHAGLDLHDRREVEDAFLRGDVRVLCCTSSLAVGINLPAYLVIIRGTRLNAGEIRDYTILETVQMMGRAGRPQFEKEGVCVIMTEQAEIKRWTDLVQGQTIIESTLHHDLVEHINAEICVRTGCTVRDIEEWLKQTFFYVRLGKRSDRHIISGCAPGCDLQTAITTLSHRVVDELNQHSLIDGYDPMVDGKILTGSNYGLVMSVNCLRWATMKELLQMPPGSTLEQLIMLCSRAAEFKGLLLRQGEAQLYESLNSPATIRFPLDKVQSVSDKVAIILQASLAGVSLADALAEGATFAHVNPKSDTREVLRWTPKIARVLLAIALERGDSIAAIHAFELLRCSSGNAWDLSPATLRQLPNVGEAYMNTLASGGIRTIPQLAKEKPHTVQILLNRQLNFVKDLIRDAEAFPRLDVSIEEHDYTIVQGRGVEMSCEVTLALANSVRELKRVRTTNDDNRLYHVALLAVTTHGSLCTYQRLPLKHLVKRENTRLPLKVMLRSADDHLRIISACDELAGTVVERTLHSACPAKAYPRSGRFEVDDVSDSSPMSRAEAEAKRESLTFAPVSPGISRPAAQPASRETLGKGCNLLQDISAINVLGDKSGRSKKAAIPEQSRRAGAGVRKKRKKEVNDENTKLLEDAIKRSKVYSTESRNTVKTKANHSPPRHERISGSAKERLSASSTNSSLPDIVQGWPAHLCEKEAEPPQPALVEYDESAKAAEAHDEESFPAMALLCTTARRSADDALAATVRAADDTSALPDETFQQARSDSFDLSGWESLDLSRLDDAAPVLWASQKQPAGPSNVVSIRNRLSSPDFAFQMGDEQQHPPPSVPAHCQKLDIFEEDRASISPYTTADRDVPSYYDPRPEDEECAVDTEVRRETSSDVPGITRVFAYDPEWDLTPT